MKLKVIVHPAEEGGYWAEVPAIPGCATQGENMKELMENVQEAIEACLSVDMEIYDLTGDAQVLEVAV
ncbi:MAG: type II toxin-antitoxin system HicB family antitoxin [Anaerolineales bacterium]|nr:type II toxin-antitoxin system HicB family antitoxin [Anaerolineales bacterium]